MSFESFGLVEPLLQAINEQGYENPTEIQAKAIPHVIEGKDLLGCAQTGTGKTAAFALPIIQRLVTHPHPDKKQSKHHARPIRALILTPTRELAAQVGDNFQAYAKHTDLRHTVIFGGVRQKGQARDLKNGIDILVATPGRLLDLMGQGLVKLSSLEIFVLDEADRMLDMGFINDIWRVVAELPKDRQTLFFSATMPSKIKTLANSILQDPVEERVAPEAPAADTVDQFVYLVEQGNKLPLLVHLINKENIERVLIFTRTKYGADRLESGLKHQGVRADVIHSDKPQWAREKALNKFREGKVNLLIASDIAARGIDIDDITHVINYDMPNEAEVYIHRIGRTGRAGREGRAYSFCALDERLLLDEVQKLLTKKIEVVADHPFPSPVPGSKVEPEKPKATGLYRHRRPTTRRRL